MSPIFKNIFTLTSAPAGVRRRSSQRAMAKKVGAVRMSRHPSEGKVQWEMLAISPISPQYGEDKYVSPAWFSSNISFPERELESPLSPPAAPIRADLKLPFEIWCEVFHHLEDGYDIHALARACKGLRDVAQDAIERHAAFVEQHRVVELRAYDDMCALLDEISSSPSIGGVIRTLTVRYDIRWNINMPATLVKILTSLPNLRTFSLHIEGAEMAFLCFRAGVLSVKLPHLRAFATSLPPSPEITRFVQSHPTLEDFSITNQDAVGNIARCEGTDLPSLRVLQCGLPDVLRFGRISTLTHLHILLHATDTLESIASLLGPQLVSLRLGVLERLPDLHSPRVVWSPQDILTRFPRLAYIQVHMFEPDLLLQPIQWQQKRDSALKIDRPHPLTVAWVLDEEAWGTSLDPRDSDVVRQLFDEVAFDVLRYWSPYIDCVVYGDSGVPDACVVLNSGGKKVVRTDPKDGPLGEDYWKRVGRFL